jgi:hypothetical protein
MMLVLMRLFAAALVVRRRYFIAASRPFPAAPLVVHRRCLIVVPMPMPEATRMLLRGVVDVGFNSLLAPRLTCGSMLEVNRDAVAAGEEQLASCAAE